MVAFLSLTDDVAIYREWRYRGGLNDGLLSSEISRYRTSPP